jgi:protein tyrosine/serine phosphatase
MSASALGGRSFRMSGRIFSGLLLSATLVPCQSPFTSEQMAGAKLKHFAKVDKNVYKGSKPTSDADFRLLQSLHVKYIVDLEILPFMTGLEQRKAKRYGITVIRGLMNASPVSPSEKHIEFVLATLRKDQPVYFHCKYGRDRTNVIAALYKMYFLGMTEPEAMRYVHDEGYKDGWVRAGLLKYIRKHPSRPDSLSAAL